MGKQNSNSNTNFESMVQFINEETLEDNEKEALASVLIGNPAVTLVKFVLTDDKPNANKQRIPVEEFGNLINTGIYMPLKKAFDGINTGHEDSFPLGVITHLKTLGDKIIAIAALWSRERPQDVTFLKERMASKTPVNVSWEILYSDSKTNEDGVTDLLDTALRAVTIVGEPAYAGRTQFLAIASKGSKAYQSELDKLSDDAFLLVMEGGKEKKRLFPYKDSDGKVSSDLLKDAISSIESSTEISEETKSHLKETVSQELMKEQQSNETEDKALDETKVKELELKVEELTGLLKTKEEELTAKANEFGVVTQELDSLRAFKAEQDAAQQNATRLQVVKTKFNESGLKRPDTYFDEHKDEFLKLDDKSLEFMIQDLVSFASKNKESSENSSSASTSTNTQIPPLSNEGTRQPTTKELAEFLKTYKKN
jgi:hypothetical protein